MPREVFTPGSSRPCCTDYALPGTTRRSTEIRYLEARTRCRRLIPTRAASFPDSERGSSGFRSTPYRWVGRTFTGTLAATLALLLLEHPVHATAATMPGAVSAHATASATTMAVSDTLILTVEVSAPEDHNPRLPQLRGMLGDFAIARSSIGAQSLHPGPPPRISQKLTLFLHPGPAGTHRIPPLKIMTGAGATVATRPIDIEVTSVLPESLSSPEPRPHEPALADESAGGNLLLLVTGPAMVVLCLLAVFCHRRRQGRLREALAPATGNDCTHRALETLDALSPDAAPSEIHAVAIAYLSSVFGRRAAALSIGDRECAQRPALAAYLRDYEETHFARTPRGDTTARLRSSLRNLIAEGAAP